MPADTSERLTVALIGSGRYAPAFVGILQCAPTTSLPADSPLTMLSGIAFESVHSLLGDFRGRNVSAVCLRGHKR